jgi:succinoglycan biosynthesis protein ExoO
LDKASARRQWPRNGRACERNQMVKTTVVIPAYNAEGLVTKAVMSVLEQTETDIEALVVDDASSDGTCDEIERLAASDPRVRLLRNPVNKGFSHTINNGMKAARGQWVACLDADDWYAPDRLERMVAAAETAGSRFVADNVYLIDEGKEEPWGTIFKARSSTPRSLSIDEFIEKDMPGRHGTMAVLQPIFRADFISEHEIFYDETVRGGADSYFMIRCLAKEPCLLLPEAMYYYLQLPSSISHQRTVKRLKELQEKNHELCAWAQPWAEKSTLDLLAARVRVSGMYIRYYHAVEPAKRGEWGAALGALARDPGMLPTVIVGLWRNLVARVRQWAVRR